MIPGRIPHATRFLGAPAGWDETRDGICATLPIRDVGDPDIGNSMVSAWQPTPDELVRLNAGASVLLAVSGVTHPPVMLSVGEPPEISP